MDRRELLKLIAIAVPRSKYEQEKEIRYNMG